MVEVLAIRKSDSAALPSLVLLHRIPANLSPLYISRPFVGSHSVYLIGAGDNHMNCITISHVPTTPPTVEELGPLVLEPGWTASNTRIGPFSSVILQEGDCIDIATYDFCPPRFFGFRSLRYKFDTGSIGPVSATAVAGLDNIAGRIVLKTGETSCFLVMDLV